MKHIMKKTIEQATPQELLLALLHTSGISEGPKRRTFNEPVMDSTVAIGPDATAYVTVFKDDIRTLQGLCARRKAGGE